jgi:hypothetical protein
VSECGISILRGATRETENDPLLVRVARTGFARTSECGADRGDGCWRYAFDDRHAHASRHDVVARFYEIVRERFEREPDQDAWIGSTEIDPALVTGWRKVFVDEDLGIFARSGGATAAR